MKILFTCILFIVSQFALQAQSNYFNSIYFETNQYHLMPSQMEEIDEMISAISEKTIEKIIVSGFCDGRADSLYNFRLSLQRANAVADYLKENGIESTSVKGYGETMSPDEHAPDSILALNRRVDIEIFLGQEIIETSDKQDLQADILQAKAGDKITIKNLNFYPGRHFILPASQLALDNLLQGMLKNPTLKIKLIGHVCCVNTTRNWSHQDVQMDGYDIDEGKFILSLARAEAVRNFLVENGIDFNRITCLGKGSSERLVNPEITAADQQMNRRVEIWILEK